MNNRAKPEGTGCRDDYLRFYEVDMILVLFLGESYTLTVSAVDACMLRRTRRGRRREWVTTVGA